MAPGPGAIHADPGGPLERRRRDPEGPQEPLSAELTAINQYFIHARMRRNWRYMRLADHAEKESIGEMKHAQEAMDRILYLEGVSNMQKDMKINVGAGSNSTSASPCMEKADYGSRVLFERILVSSPVPRAGAESVRPGPSPRRPP
jgi:hypothetical protein